MGRLPWLLLAWETQIRAPYAPPSSQIGWQWSPISQNIEFVPRSGARAAALSMPSQTHLSFLTLSPRLSAREIVSGGNMRCVTDIRMKSFIVRRSPRFKNCTAGIPVQLLKQLAVTGGVRRRISRKMCPVVANLLLKPRKYVVVNHAAKAMKRVFVKSRPTFHSTSSSVLTCKRRRLRCKTTPATTFHAEFT